MNRSAHYTPFLAKAIRDLDAGINSHARWLSAFHQAMICGSKQLDDVASAEAHRLCGFGQWFHDRLDVAEWAEWKADLEKIDALHRVVHAGARGMMNENRKIGQAACAELYEAFAESVMRLELALRELQNKLVGTVCLVDPLTGVWNRSSLQQRLGEEYSRMQRCGQPSALCMMDLDHFKAVNDTFGHVVGDKVLQSATEVAKKRLRTYDSIFRYGGEEFLFCLPNISAEVATTAMDRVRAELEESTVRVSDGREIRVTASFGVTPFLPDLSLEENIETADRAMFRAKTEGRNRVYRWH